MYRHIVILKKNVSSIKSSNFFSYIIRGYCDVSKTRKRRQAKVSLSNVSKLSDNPENVSANVISKNKVEKCKTILIHQATLESTNLNSIVDKELSVKKRQIKKGIKDDTKTNIKAKKTSSSSSSHNEPNEEIKLSLSERYGDSLSMPGMKPFSVSKKKTKPPCAQDTKKNVEALPEINGEAVNQTKDVVSTLPETFDITDAIPKIRSPLFRMEQKLEVPMEWGEMKTAWSPSDHFLKTILNYPISGTEKTTDVCGTDFVNCFVSANKNAAKVVPAVTTVLSKTMTPAQAFALNLWRQRLIKQLGEEGFQQHRTDILTRGKQFHDTIQRYLHGEPVENLNLENLPLISGCWKSLIPVLNRIDDVIAVESEVLHPQLLYRGVIDCIVEIKGQPFIVEWKHSSRKRESLQKNYDSPVQLMAYTGAINSNPSYPFGVKNSLLVVAYEDGSPADVFVLSAPQNGEHHWHIWLKRLHTYWTLLKAERELGN